MDQVKEKLTKTKLLGLIGTILTIISVFLPFATVKANVLGVKASQSTTFIEGDGIFVLVLAIIALLMVLASTIATKVPFFGKLAKTKLVLIPTILSAIILIIDMANASELVGSASSSIAKVTVSYGIGTWVLWIGLILTAVYAFIYKKAE